MINTYKICVLGDSGVGKTSFCKTLCDNTNAKSPLNVFVTIVNGNIVELWDFAGSDKYQ